MSLSGISIHTGNVRAALVERVLLALLSGPYAARPAFHAAIAVSDAEKIADEVLRSQQPEQP